MVSNKIKNINISSNYDDHIMRIIRKSNNYYEFGLLNKIKNMDIIGVYLDVGANIGNHTIFFSTETKATHIHSFEICDETYEILNRNVTNNNLNNVTTHNYGLGETTKLVKLSDIDSDNLGMVKVVDGIGDKKITTIDSLGIGNVGLIKIDVEGYEYNVIMGAKKTIEKYHPIIVAELHSTEEFNKFYSELKKLNYTSDGKNYASSPTYIFT